MFEIEFERPEHQAAIDALLDLSFGPGRYAKTAQRLREGNRAIPELCYVAFANDVTGDGKVERRMVGSLSFWPVVIGGVPGLMLGPLAVEPRLRGQGCGVKLMQRGLADAEALGYRLVILVGDAPYYAKVGFAPVPPGRRFRGRSWPDHEACAGDARGACSEDARHIGGIVAIACELGGERRIGRQCLETLCLPVGLRIVDGNEGKPGKALPGGDLPQPRDEQAAEAKTARPCRQRNVVEEEAVGLGGEAAEQAVQRGGPAEDHGMRDRIAERAGLAFGDEAALRKEREPFGRDGDVLGIGGMDDLRDLIDRAEIRLPHRAPV